MSMTITDDEMGTVRAALQLWQRCRDGHLHTYTPDEMAMATADPGPILTRIDGEASDADEEYYRQRAFELWHRDGEIEIDGPAVVSVSEDGGAYVQAWVWVDDARASAA